MGAWLLGIMLLKVGASMQKVLCLVLLYERKGLELLVHFLWGSVANVFNDEHCLYWKGKDTSYV